MNPLWLVPVALAAYEFLFKPKGGASSVSFEHPAPNKDTVPPPKPKPKPQPKPNNADKPAHPKAVRSREQAARNLYTFLKSNPQSEWGTKAHRSAVVKAAQLDMGALLADGIYGPLTQHRAETLTGMTFPSRAVALSLTRTPPPSTKLAPTASSVAKVVAPYKPLHAQPAGRKQSDDERAHREAWERAHPGAAQKQPLQAVQLPMGRKQSDDARAERESRAKSPPPERPVPAAHQRSPEEAAQALFTYLDHTPPSRWGAKGEPNATIQKAQRDMGGGLVTDGIYGPKTQARGAALTGHAFPARSSGGASKAHANATRSKEDAASELLAFLQSHPDRATWGTRAVPSAVVKQAQLDMGALLADGIYGPKTQARGHALLGRTFPTR